MVRTYHEKYETGFPVEELIRILTKVNELINDQNYFVGVSFFLRNDLQEHIESIWSTEILPYLMEYLSSIL